VLRPETVLVGDVKVVVVPGDGADAVETALGEASPGATVVVAASEPDQTLRDLARFGGVVVNEDGDIRRPDDIDMVEGTADGASSVSVDVRSAGVEIRR
jgi:hypothetical protein